MEYLIINYNVSITDVIQAASSLFAAIGLVWTLVLQKKATDASLLATRDQIKSNEAQIEVAQRDYERFVVELEPKFKFTEFSFNHATLDGSLVIVVENNPAYDVLFEYKDRDAISIDGLSTEKYDHNIGDRVFMPFKIFDTEKFFSNEDDELNIFSIRIQYKDKLGNNYTQLIGIAPQTQTLIAKVPVMEKSTINIPLNQRHLAR